jgi:hypothetical protein
MTVYEVRPRKDHRGVDLISDALPFGRLWYGEPDAISNAVEQNNSINVCGETFLTHSVAALRY